MQKGSVIKFDNGLSFEMGETYEEVMESLKASKDIIIESDEYSEILHRRIVSIISNQLIRNYRCICSIKIEDDKKLSHLAIEFDIHDYIKRNGGYPDNYDYTAWLNFCITVENDIKNYVDNLSRNVEIVRKWHHDYTVRIGDLIYCVSHGREYEQGIYLSIGTVKDYEEEYGEIKEPYIE